jgi:undecaprenyl-diphosphatase
MLLLALALLNPIERLDLAGAAAVQRGRRPALEATMHAASAWGRPAAVVAVAVLAADAVGGAGWSAVRLAVVALAGTNVVVESLKLAVGRVRPDGSRSRSNASFPSSHAANAFALAWVLSARWRRGAPAFFALALLVAFSRLYLNRHFPSDVVAGALIGLVVAWLAARSWPVHRRDRAIRPVPAGPPASA